MKFKFTFVAFLVTVITFAQNIDNALLHGMNFRSIGPAGMSGRVTSIDVVQTDQTIIYAGTSAGSLWKSTNAGTSWQPIFENQKTASVGDLAIYQKNPNVIYLGTGEGNPRNSQNYGYGMYKSLDGGKTWKHLGLEKTKSIHRVIVHPDNPDVVWVGAIGTAWGTTEDRGVYKTTDGGDSWKKILYTNTSTGVADMVMDPFNPNKIMVAMWEYQRWPWFMNSGGPGSAIHVTMDGGDSWLKLGAANGLPDETLGRIGLAISRSNPNVVYANIETKPENAMWRSDNGGQTFKKTTAQGVGDRPFYYADVEVDPNNENRVYHIATTISRSEDGGKSFKPMLDFFGGVHSDHHAFWINPENSSHILDGNDGGFYASHDMGKTWRFSHNLPAGQFYHINVDNEMPYNVYGGMQDNGSWVGPAYKFAMFGKIHNYEWKGVGFGDGFDVIPDPRDSRYGYSMSQGGNFQRYDRLTGIVQTVMPEHPDGVELRFNWDAGMNTDPFDLNVVYGGSQFVHKSTDNGNSWTIISPDLTTNDPEKQKQHESGGLTIDDSTAENHTTILVIEPSSRERGLIWVGTDDGNVQITRDGGNTWTNVGGNIKGVPANSWVAQIKHSKHNNGEAFAVIEDHRRDNWTPYVYRTRDYGKSWERIVDQNDVWGFALSFVQDPIQPNLMFVGTEFGLYFSLDGAKNWQQWKKDFPTVSVKDMVIQPREHDLVVGTFGRSIWILDDIRPLRALATNMAIKDKAVHMFEPADAYLGVVGFPEFFGGASESFAGKNREMGAIMNYYAKEGTKKDGVIIEISNADGEVVREIKTMAKPGVNRVMWDLKTRGSMVPGKPDLFSMFLMGGANVFYGDYTVTAKIGENSDSKTITVLKDPKTPVSDEDFKTNIERKVTFNKSADMLMGTYKKVEGAIKSLKQVKPFVEKDEALKEEHAKLSAQAEELKYKIIPRNLKGLFDTTPDLRSQLLSVAMYYFNPMSQVDNNSEIRFGHVKKKIAKVNAEIGAFEEAMKSLKKKVNDSDLMTWD
ncbi:MAG: hypothetical protein HKN54_09830 [Flavobacteriaceae bacterium]|nr:hypothetical protein [Flavobacteriaceae bacterium]